MNWFTLLKDRNESLFWFGLVCFALAVVFFVLSRMTQIQVMGVNAWYKPIKFSLSIGIFSWTMAWFMYHLGPGKDITIFNWLTIILFGFEILYIAFQAGKGELSHFNLSTPVYSALYSMMAIAATVVTLATAYMGVRFFQMDFPELPDYYIWAIRLGIILFVIFSFEGFVMGSRLTHTIGGPDGGKGIPFLNWSLKYGDPRVAHFIGMHALQLLPLLSFYLLKNVKITFSLAIVYGLMAVYVLMQALQGKPFARL